MHVRVVVGLIVCCLSRGARAAEQPLWEIGFGAALLNVPDYRGADDRSSFVLPMPYVVYRGEILKADGDSVRGLLLKTDRLEINVNVAGSTPVNSDDVDARQGMPDLDPALEIGPSVNYTIARDAQGDWEWQLRAPLRAVISSDFSSVDYRGVVFAPNLNLDVQNTALGPGWRWGTALGPVFASGRNHEYYYSVGPQFATLMRPEYDADGGYSGFRITTALTKHFAKVWIGGYVRYENLAGAAFHDSPLANADNGFSFGIAVAWIFKKSLRMVEVD